MEYNIIGKMLMEGLDVYIPLVDDHGVDAIIKKEDGTFIEIQIKARSSEVKLGDAALFAACFTLYNKCCMHFSGSNIFCMWNVR